jgi:hypothetical protein
MKKERYTEEIRIVAPPSLYKPFVEKCEKQYKTISQVLRELMVEYIIDDIQKEGEDSVNEKANL